MPSALILIADGTEEMEFTIAYDMLIRAGVSCTSAFVPDTTDSHKPTSPPLAKGSRGINILPDTYFIPSNSGPDKFDALVIPGGAKGADTISKSPAVQELVREYIKQSKIVGMICAGSLAALTSTLPKQKLTSHPSVKSQLENDFDYSEDPVVVSGNLVTSRGPGELVNCLINEGRLICFVFSGTAFPFALTLIELLCGAEKRNEVRGPLVLPSGTPF